MRHGSREIRHRSSMGSLLLERYLTHMVCVYGVDESMNSQQKRTIV